MSEHQYYAWQTIDRLLSAAEQNAVDGLSSHIDVTSSQAVVTYDWGNFKHDPRQVLAQYFDAFLYIANWGTRLLMFRFPAGMLDEAALAPYLVEESISLYTEARSHILEFALNDEEPEWDWIEDEEDGTLSAVASLRNDILEGDYRGLYVAWLGAMSLLDPDDFAGIEEPPLPAGLGQLTPALARLARFFNIDEALIASAAAASPAKAAAGLADAALQDAISQLSRAECEAYLMRLAQGEPGVGLSLRQQLKRLVQPVRAPAAVKPRRLAEIYESVEQLRRAAAQREAQGAEERRIADLRNLAQREGQVWQEIEALLQKRSGSAYDQAIAKLVQLSVLAGYQNTRTDFNRRVGQLREQYKSRPAFIERLTHKGLA